MSVPTTTLLTGDATAVLSSLDADSVQTVITSPPYYGLRDYGVDGQIGREPTVHEYVSALVDVFLEVGRVLRDDGTLWLVLGDSYATKAVRASGDAGLGNRAIRGARLAGSMLQRDKAGLADKNLLGIPWRVAFALQAQGWILRSDIIWAKEAPVPTGVTDRPTSAHEYIFLFARQRRYVYDADAIKTRAKHPGWRATYDGSQKNSGHQNRTYPGAQARVITGGDWVNRRDVWFIRPQPFPEAHFAVFPEELVSICMKAGTRIGDTALDPFSGAGTVGVVAKELDRHYVGIDINPEYHAMARRRIASVATQPSLIP